MGSFFENKMDALGGLPAAFASNPWFFIITLAIGLPLIWWKWKVTTDGIKSSIDDVSHGLRVKADRQQVIHEAGVGMRDVLVMRPPKIPKMVYFSLVFFGGGAVFYLFSALPGGEATREDWMTFAGLCSFGIILMVLIELNQTTYFVSENSIQRRRVLHRRQTISFSDVARVDPHAKKYSLGLIILSRDGDKMRVLARFSGYRDLMERITRYDPLMLFASKHGKEHYNA